MVFCKFAVIVIIMWKLDDSSAHRSLMTAPMPAAGTAASR